MSLYRVDHLSLCPDCAGIIANGTVGNGDDDEDERQGQLIEAMWGADATRLIVDCDQDEDGNETCPAFSSTPCDGCGSHLADSRHLGALIPEEALS